MSIGGAVCCFINSAAEMWDGLFHLLKLEEEAGSANLLVHQIRIEKTLMYCPYIVDVNFLQGIPC